MIREHRNKKAREWRQTEGYREYTSKYKQSEGCKLSRKKYKQSEKGRKSQKKYREAHREMCHLSVKRATVKHKYGISLEELQQLIDKHENRCGICKRLFVRSPHIDHDHRTGRIRGLLCFNCNSILGKIDDDINILDSMKLYLVS